MIAQHDSRGPAECIAVLGTGSDVGKSIVATALCRMLKNAGLSVAPFKAQNMSNNSFVTVEGGEMGRAQVAQAEAAGIEPHVDMNPILLKPASDVGSQVVVHGTVLGTRNAGEYWLDTAFLFGKAKESLDRLRKQYRIVVMEGAGSCAEMNLLERDFVNFRMAEYAGAPVLLVADIDRGGVFAQVIGTLAILPPAYKNMVKGIVINRFRGDASLFQDGIEYIEEKTGLPVLGLIPYFHDIDVDSEDGVVLDARVRTAPSLGEDRVAIAVLKLPHISNFTDFNPLQRDESVRLKYVYAPESLDDYDLVILPGTKNVRFDIEWLRERGWTGRIEAYAKNGGFVCGVCGGYQMLGRVIRDPHGMEGNPGETPGLGLLDVETTLLPEKTLSRVEGFWYETGARFSGYEIHMGKTALNPGVEPFVRISMKNDENASADDGAVSPDKRIWGCYVHGFFDRQECVRALFGKLKPHVAMGTAGREDECPERFKDRQYEQLARHFMSHLRVPLLEEILGCSLFLAGKRER